MKTEELYNRLLEKQEQMADDIGEIKVILARQEESLRHHIHRTELAEEAIAINKRHLDIAIAKLNEELKPIHKHVIMINTGFKLIGSLSVLLSIAAGIIKLFSLLI